MSETLLLMGPLLPAIQKELESTYDVHRYWEAIDRGALLTDIAERCIGVVTDGARGVKNAVLDRLPHAELVAVFGVGVDAVDLEYCQERGIRITNTPDVLSGDVADLAVLLALATCRRLIEGDTWVRRGAWAAKRGMGLATRMFNKKAGIYGMGNIGSVLARRLTGFGMDISYCNRHEKTGSPHRFFASLTDLAREVDFLFVTAAATPGTIGSVTDTVLDALGPHGWLINVARGALIDEPALLKALQERRIAGAGLDVFVDEPNVPAGFLELDNVVLQPHVASATRETRQAMGQLVLDNLSAHVGGRPLPTPVV